MFTRAQPVASARASDSSSRMPPDISTFDVQLADDLRQQRRVRPAPERRVQVHQVQPRRAGRLPRQRGVHRVAVGRLAPGGALHQPDRLAAGHVDGGQQDQFTHKLSSQLDRTAAPASPDFSGWNCVAETTPCSTAAANGSPCSVTVIFAPASSSGSASAMRSA